MPNYVAPDIARKLLAKAGFNLVDLTNMILLPDYPTDQTKSKFHYIVEHNDRFYLVEVPVTYLLVDGRLAFNSVEPLVIKCLDPQDFSANGIYGIFSKTVLTIRNLKTRKLGEGSEKSLRDILQPVFETVISTVEGPATIPIAEVMI